MRFTEAIDWFLLITKSTDDNERLSTVETLLGETYMQIGDKAEAAVWYERAALRGSFVAQTNLATHHVMNQDVKTAEKFYLMAAKSGNVDVMFALGMIYQKLKNLKNSLHYYLLAANGGHFDAQAEVASNYAEQNKMELAEIWARKVLAQQPYLSCQAVIMKAAFSKNNFNEGIKLATALASTNFATAVDSSSVSPEEKQNWIIFAQETLAEHYAKLGYTENALRWWLLVTNKSAITTIRIAMAFLTLGRHAEATHWLDRAELMNHPDVPTLRLVLQAKMQPESPEHFIALQQLANSGDIFAQFSLGLRDALVGDYEAAKINLRNAAKRYSGAQTILAEIFLDEKLYHEALLWAKQGLARGAYLCNLVAAQAYQALGDDVQAEHYYLLAISYGDFDAAYYYGQFLYGRVQLEQARAAELFYQEHDETEAPTMVSQASAKAADQSSQRTRHDQIKTATKRISAITGKVLAERSADAPIIEKSFVDVETLILKGAQTDIDANKLTRAKIQGFLSVLGRGGEKRARVKQLAGHKQVYSMRLDKGNRFVFRIERGSLDNGVSAVTIISVKGHYKNVEHLYYKTGTPVVW